MNKRAISGLRRILLLPVLGVAITAAEAPPTAVVAARRTSMHELGEVMRALRTDVLAGKDPAALLSPTLGILSWSSTLMTDFPLGSEGGPTNALATVWTDRAGFAAAVARMRAAAEQMVSTARAGDRAGFAAAYRATDDACGACHRQYRQR